MVDVYPWEKVRRERERWGGGELKKRKSREFSSTIFIIGFGGNTVVQSDTSTALYSKEKTDTLKCECVIFNAFQLPVASAEGKFGLHSTDLAFRTCSLCSHKRLCTTFLTHVVILPYTCKLTLMCKAGGVPL